MSAPFTKRRPVNRGATALDAAEPPTDPLDGLIGRIKADPDAPFDPETLKALHELEATNSAAFEKLLPDLKRAGVSITKLRKALRDLGGGRPPPLADRILALAQEKAELFHAPNGDAYALLQTEEGGPDTYRVNSTRMRKWLTRLCLKEIGGTINRDALATAIDTLAALADAGEEHPTPIRVAKTNGTYWIDLGDDQGRAICIRDGRSKIVKQPAPRFIRSASSAPLPVPEPGGSVEDLRRFFNVRKGDDWRLLLVWLLYCLQAEGAYPPMVVAGDQGSAKSTFLNLVRMLVDPRRESLPSLPRNEDDLFIRGSQRHLLAFDNVSAIPDWTSDALCRIAMGGTQSKRLLYSDADEAVITTRNPILLNGITRFITQSDLADRSILLTLAPIPKEKRRPEKILMADYEAALPGIFGALLDVLAEALLLLPSIDLDEHPRMADFARFGVAVERAMDWKAGSFLAAYSRNQANASMDMVEADAVATTLRNMMSGRRQWRGTYAELLFDLNEEWGTAPRPRDWPLSPKALQLRLDRVRPALRASGIDAPRPTREGHASVRMLTITHCDDDAEEPAALIHVTAPSRGTVNVKARKAALEKRLRDYGVEDVDAERQPPRKVNGHRHYRTQEAAAARRGSRMHQSGRPPRRGEVH